VGAGKGQRVRKRRRLKKETHDTATDKSSTAHDGELMRESLGNGNGILRGSPSGLVRRARYCEPKIKRDRSACLGSGRSGGSHSCRKGTEKDEGWRKEINFKRQKINVRSKLKSHFLKWETL